MAANSSFNSPNGVWSPRRYSDFATAIGYSDCFPLPGNDNATEEHRRMNRRIEIVFER